MTHYAIVVMRREVSGSMHDIAPTPQIFLHRIFLAQCRFVLHHCLIVITDFISPLLILLSDIIELRLVVI